MLEHVETTNEKKKKKRVGKICWSISSPPPIFPRTIREEDPRPFNSQQICPDPSPPLGGKLERELFREWEESHVLRTWRRGWDQPGWETSSKKMVPKGRREWSEERGGVKCVKLRVNRGHFGGGLNFRPNNSPMMKVFRREKEARSGFSLWREGKFAACKWKEKIIGPIWKAYLVYLAIVN